MRKVLFFLCAVFAFQAAYAQNRSHGGYSASDLKRINKFPMEVTLDKSNMECIYEHWVYDTFFGHWTCQEMILLHGNKYSEFMDYQMFRLDSVESTKDKKHLTIGEIQKIRKDYNIVTSSNSYSYLIRNNKTGKYDVHDKVMIDGFVYQDSLPKWNWKLSDSTTTYCGHVCRKATTHFRGRDWIAWYSDIPVNAGPWKFSGLPGLILAVYDTTTHQRFIANTLRKGGNAVKKVDRKEMKTTREYFNKALKEYKMNPLGIIGGTDLMPNAVNEVGNTTTPNRRLFFNPIELE
ncbi:MAG: GLPGLI family protein [Bacteroidaceae bacterium]|nr:GLPGLI family protein [Bacteroidaceae bacterium]